jgi:hypothetical protein
VSLRDPIAAADLSRIRAADAVLAAALAWEHATNGRPMSEQERRLRESVLELRRKLKAKEHDDGKPIVTIKSNDRAAC